MALTKRNSLQQADQLRLLVGQLDLHGLRRGRRSSQLESEHPDLESVMVVRRIFGENGAQEGAVAQRRRRLVGQGVAGGAHRTLLAFALKETEKISFTQLKIRIL